MIFALSNCPTGKSLVGLSSPLRKNFLIFRSPKSLAYLSPSRSLERGAARDRHGRWERDAVDANGALDEAR
jgi:hypothetical protein